MVDIGAIVQGAVGTGEAIYGLVIQNQAKKELKKLIKNMPKYSRPEEYEKLLSIYQQQAGMGQLPGQDRYEAALSERTARGTRAIGKYADSPVAAVAATMGLYGREQQAIRDLGLQFANYKTAAQQRLAGAYQIGMEEAGKEFSYNQWYPHQVKMNMAAAKYNEGQQALWGGIDQMAASGVNYGSMGMGGATGGSTTQGGQGIGAGLNSSYFEPQTGPSLSPVNAYSTQLGRG